MKPIDGHFQINPEDLSWRPSNQMRVPNADILERTGSQLLGARYWRLPPMSANTWHRHIKAEELYVVLEGTGRIRIGDETLTVQKHGSVLVGPAQMRQIFNDTATETLWLIIGAPDNELERGEAMDMKRFWPENPKQLPKELAGATWPPAPNAPPS